MSLFLDERIFQTKRFLDSYHRYRRSTVVITYEKNNDTYKAGIIENSINKIPPSLMKLVFDETEFDENLDSYLMISM